MDKHSSNVWCLHDLSQIFYAFPKFPRIFSIASFHLHIMYCQLLYIKCQRFYQKRDYIEQNFFQMCNRRKSNLHKKLGFHPRPQKLQNFGKWDRFYALLYFSYNHLKWMKLFNIRRSSRFSSLYFYGFSCFSWY